MKKLLATVASAALLGLAASANAAEVRGVVESVNETDNQITLVGGDTFTLTDTVSAGDLEPGDVVDITWYHRDTGSFKQASDVDVMMPASAREATPTADVPQGQTARGVVAEVDPTNNRIRLANGDTFALGATPHASDLMPGDIVQLKWWQHENGIKQVYDLERIHEIAVTDSQMTPSVPQGTRIEGTIANVNHTDNRITLTNGATFALGTGEESSDFAPGQRVALTWNHWQQGFRLANNVEKIAP